jgi:hypothetical protein
MDFSISPAQRARSDAYFEGGYWLIVWDFLSTVVVMWLLLHFSWSARMRNLASSLYAFGVQPRSGLWLTRTVASAKFTSELELLAACQGGNCQQCI